MFSAGSVALAQSLSLPAPQHDLQPASPWSQPFPNPQGSRTQAVLASRVSRPILPDGESFSPASLSAASLSTASLTTASLSARPPLASIEPPPAWSSIEEDLKRAVDNCERLLRRGAVRSAREEVVRGLRLLSRTLDLHHPSLESERRMERARTALEESVDLEQASPSTLASVLAGHSTPLLRQASLERLSVSVAAQHYRALARIEWVTAAGGHPWGADLLYALGRTYDRQAEQEPARQRSLHQQSLVCYEAAAQIAPTRHFVTCQLGTSLLKMERTSEALEAFRASLTAAPSAEAWHGLAESYRRLGDISNADAARQQAMEAAETRNSYSPMRPQIVQVAPEEFARFSPSHVIPHPRESLHGDAGSANEPARVASQPSGNRSSPSATSVGSRWLPSIFR